MLGVSNVLILLNNFKIFDMIKRNITFDKEKLLMYAYHKTIHYFPNFLTLDFVTGKTEFKVVKDDTYYRFRVTRSVGGVYFLSLYHERKRTLNNSFTSVSLTHLMQDVYDYIFC